MVNVQEEDNCIHTYYNRTGSHRLGVRICRRLGASSCRVLSRSMIWSFDRECDRPFCKFSPTPNACADYKARSDPSASGAVSAGLWACPSRRPGWKSLLCCFVHHRWNFLEKGKK
ncbi:hypothetical protein T02_2845 [Trichinella nativa]|uniref:Uncharacterized protein n=1 Tax=Trichinella nativa TaxID=6335 RepID=A0A0V1KXX4_9BILA|nr:hypothetical protein T02_2845 [Trichinella nativa]